MLFVLIYSYSSDLALWNININFVKILKLLSGRVGISLRLTSRSMSLLTLEMQLTRLTRADAFESRQIKLSLLTWLRNFTHISAYNLLLNLDTLFKHWNASGGYVQGHSLTPEARPREQGNIYISSPTHISKSCMPYSYLSREVYQRLNLGHIFTKAVRIPNWTEQLV